MSWLIVKTHSLTQIAIILLCHTHTDSARSREFLVFKSLNTVQKYIFSANFSLQNVPKRTTFSRFRTLCNPSSMCTLNALVSSKREDSYMEINISLFLQICLFLRNVTYFTSTLVNIIICRRYGKKTLCPCKIHAFKCIYKLFSYITGYKREVYALSFNVWHL